MKSAAERMREMRARRALERDGFVRIEGTVKTIDGYVKKDRLVLALIEDGFLKEWDEHDPAAINAAFFKMVDAFTTSLLGPDEDRNAGVTGPAGSVWSVGEQSFNPSRKV